MESDISGIYFKNTHEKSNTAQAKGRKEGTNGRVKRRQTQARGVGCRFERRRVACGVCGRRPGGHHFAPGEEVEK